MYFMLNYSTSHLGKQIYYWLLASLAMSFIHIGCDASHTPPSEVNSLPSEVSSPEKVNSFPQEVNSPP